MLQRVRPYVLQTLPQQTPNRGNVLGDIHPPKKLESQTAGAFGWFSLLLLLSLLAHLCLCWPILTPIWVYCALTLHLFWPLFDPATGVQEFRLGCFPYIHKLEPPWPPNTSKSDFQKFSKILDQQVGLQGGGANLWQGG